MPYVNIRIVRQAIAADPEAKKAEIGRRVVEAITDVTGLAPGDVWVVFDEVEAANWYLGPDSVQKLRFSG